MPKLDLWFTPKVVYENDADDGEKLVIMVS